MKTNQFHTELPYQKPMLRQIECSVQNRPVTKNGVLPVTTLFFRKHCFRLRASYKELIWCNNDPNVHIPISCKRWSFIWGCFFSVSILKLKQVFLQMSILFFSGCERLIRVLKMVTSVNWCNKLLGTSDFFCPWV